MSATFGARVRDYLDRREDPVDLPLLLTLALIVVRPAPGEHFALVISSTILGICGLLDGRLRRAPAFWWAMTALYFVWANGYNWLFSDNHKFLTTYWCMAIATALHCAQPAEALRRLGGWLVGLVFLLATLWKLTSASYMDGTVFRVLLLTDTRFLPLAHYLGGLPVEMAQANARAMAAMPQFLPQIPVQANDGIGPLGFFLTWWTILIEGAIAVLFLWPKGSERIRTIGHVVLLVFIITTYPPTSVVHFGWILAVMALANTPTEARRLRIAYFAAFLFIYVFSTGEIRSMLTPAV